MKLCRKAYKNLTSKIECYSILEYYSIFGFPLVRFRESVQKKPHSKEQGLLLLR